MARTRRRLTGKTTRRVAAAVALAAIIAVVVVVVTSSGSHSPSGIANAAVASGAATVQRQNLILTDTESGTLSYSDPQTVYNRLNGTITWLPAVGQEIKPGGVLFRVDGEPVILMDGTTPAYRDLSAADDAGSDIEQLNRNLKRLGFDAAAITVDDIWQPATTEGVELLQESLGETATGILTLGQVVFLPGPQLVSALDTTVGSTGGAGGGSATADDVGSGDPPPEFVSLTTDIRSRRRRRAGSSHRSSPSRSSATEAKTLSELTKALEAESLQLRAATAELRAEQHSSKTGTGGGSSPSSSSGSGADSGANAGGDAGSGASAEAILQTTQTKLVVTVDLAASSQSEARVGEKVGVELPAGNKVTGRITAVSHVAQNSSSGAGGAGSGSGGSGGSGAGSSGSSTVPVTIALPGRHTGAGLDQAAVSVSFVQQEARNVLSVPVTALVATSGTSYALQEATPPHRLIPITPGLFAAGYVKVSGPGVYPGLQVTDSQG